MSKPIANQCVSCGAEMPEGDHVCRGCRMPRYYVSESTNTILELDKGYAMICGKVFNDVPSFDWLAEAVREKMEREAKK